MRGCGGHCRIHTLSALYFSSRLLNTTGSVETEGREEEGRKDILSATSELVPPIFKPIPQMKNEINVAARLVDTTPVKRISRTAPIVMAI